MTVRDIESAYRNVMIHPCDWGLMVNFVDGWWVNVRGPFGARSLPGIVHRLARLTMWMIQREVALHRVRLPGDNILDDYLFLYPLPPFGIPRKVWLKDVDSWIDGVFKDLGWPLKLKKCKKALRRGVFIGIGVDLDRRIIFVPDDKRKKYLEHLSKLHGTCPRIWNLKSFRSLLGKLVFTSAMVPLARTRLHHLYSCLHGALKQLKNVVCLSSDALLDLFWWEEMLTHPRLHHPIRPRVPQSFQNMMFTDASPYGIGGHWNGEFFGFETSVLGRSQHISVLELLALIVAVTIWKDCWRESHIHWLADTACNVAGIRKLRTSCLNLLHLHNLLDPDLFTRQIDLESHHIPGDDNVLADDLSRNKFYRVF